MAQPGGRKGPASGATCCARIKRHELLQKFQKELDKAEKLRWAESSQKKFELYQQVQALKAQMEEIINGQAENA